MAATLAGRVALVTGGSAGIGRAAALTFAREGASVVIAARRVQEGQETARMVERAGGTAQFVQADVSIARDVEALIERCVETYGGLHCAFNNAGVEGMPDTPTAGHTEEDWDRIIDINLKGVWLCMKYEILHMLEHGGGAIVNNASVLGLVGQKIGVAYVASKHGVIGLTKTAALEYAQQGIRINAVCPGYIRTAAVERFAANDPEGIAKAIATEPIGRMGTPDEVAEAVVWLCSDAAGFVTGHSMAVDGGYVAQ